MYRNYIWNSFNSVFNMSRYQLLKRNLLALQSIVACFFWGGGVAELEGVRNCVFRHMRKLVKNEWKLLNIVMKRTGPIAYALKLSKTPSYIVLGLTPQARTALKFFDLCRNMSNITTELYPRDKHMKNFLEHTHRKYFLFNERLNDRPQFNSRRWQWQMLLLYGSFSFK